MARTLQARFGVELIVPSCFADASSSSFEAGYNATVEAHVDGVYGAGSVAAVWEEIPRRRKEDSDDRVASERFAVPGAAPAPPGL